jgi:hypothetical protein
MFLKTRKKVIIVCIHHSETTNAFSFFKTLSLKLPFYYLIFHLTENTAIIEEPPKQTFLPNLNIETGSSQPREIFTTRGHLARPKDY